MANPLQTDIDKLVREFVANSTGLDFDTNVIPGNDSNPAPNGPYATVLQLLTQGVGIDSEVASTGIDDEHVNLDQKGSRSITYSIQFFKDGAADFAESLLSYQSTAPGQLWLAENGLTWRIAGDIINLDAVMGSKFEQRRAIEISFRYQSVRQVSINSIGSVDLDINLSAESDLTENLEVSDA